METPSLAPWKRNDYRGARAGFLLQFLERMGGGFDERRPQDQIFGRVTDQHEFGEDNEVGSESSGVIPGAANDREVASDVSDKRINLRDRYRKAHFKPIVTRPGAGTTSAREWNYTASTAQ